MENSNLPPESAETSREDQMDFTEALRTVTYKLRVERRSGGLHRSISHLHAEGVETSRECQVDFTEALRTVAYPLGVQAEKVM